ncbi:MAG: hypothetical protein V4450_12465 [Bacteroidota bacterium]
MRTQLCMLLLASLGSSAFAQTKTIPNVVVVGGNEFIIPLVNQDTIRLKDRFKQRIPNNNMPNVLQLALAPPVYQGNNGKGFDIYKSTVDNMPILMNDSSFVSNMPLLKTRIDTLPLNGYYRRWPTQPKPYVFPKNK